MAAVAKPVQGWRPPQIREGMADRVWSGHHHPERITLEVEVEESSEPEQRGRAELAAVAMGAYPRPTHLDLMARLILEAVVVPLMGLERAAMVGLASV